MMKGHKHRVLIVDDNVDIRYMLKKSLEIEGYEVFTAENGSDAQEKIETMGKPCLIFLDLMMPIMDGWQFLDWIKGKPDLEKLPVVVISALGNDKKPTGGIVGFIKKPVSFPQILNFAENFC